MADFKTKLSYGGVSTWRPEKGYDPRRQHDVLDRMFGDKNPKGPVTLPDGSDLYIGYRSHGKQLYSNGHKPESKGPGFALFTPSVGSGPRRPMITQEITGRQDGENQFTYVGFVPHAFKTLLFLGRHSLQECLAGERLDFRRTGQPSEESARLLTDLTLWDAFEGDPEATSEFYLQDFYEAMKTFLGEELAEIEFADPQDEAFGKFGDKERPFEQFTVDMIGRVAEIAR